MCHLCSFKTSPEADVPLDHYRSVAMAGGGPVPVPTSDPDQKILSIADLEKAASEKLEKSARGKSEFSITSYDASLFVFFSRYLFGMRFVGISRIFHSGRATG